MDSMADFPVSGRLLAGQRFDQASLSPMEIRSKRAVGVLLNLVVFFEGILRLIPFFPTYRHQQAILEVAPSFKTCVW